jgi:hypothetical protein
VERSLHVEREHRKDHNTKELEGITDEIEAAFATECHAEDIFEVERDFPRIQRYALFVSMMGMLEANVVGLCRVAHRIFGTPKDFKDRAPQVVARGVKYLEGEAEIDTSRFRYFIDLAQNLNLLRNCITHAEGSLKCRDDAESIKEFIEGIPTVGIDDRERLVLREDFVEKTTHAMHTFLERLHDALRKTLNAETDQLFPKKEPENTFK